MFLILSQNKTKMDLRDITIKIEAYVNKQVIEELEEVLKSHMDIKETPFISAINLAKLNLAKRIKQLKEN